jgi:hypothetical protein
MELTTNYHCQGNLFGTDLMPQYLNKFSLLILWIVTVLWTVNAPLLNIAVTFFVWFVWAVPMINNNQCYLMDVKQCRWLVLMSILTNVREKQEPIKNGHSRDIVRCCIYLTTYDWIKSFLKITMKAEPYMES